MHAFVMLQQKFWWLIRKWTKCLFLYLFIGHSCLWNF